MSLGHEHGLVLIGLAGPMDVVNLSLSCPHSYTALNAAICPTSLFSSPHSPDSTPLYPSMHADTLRPPPAPICIKVGKCQLKFELTTAIFDPEACSSARETHIRRAFVSSGHYLVHPPADLP